MTATTSERADDVLLVDVDGPLLVGTINRPRALNALNSATLDALARFVARLQADDQIRVAVLTGAGERAFIAGADIAELSGLTGESARVFARRGQALLDQLEHAGKPVIAAINGFALGGGCEVAMACTIRLAAESAQLGQPEVDLGLIPGFGGTQRLSRLVGRGRALELLLTGRRITAGEAERIGLVHRVVTAAELLPAARELAALLAGKAPLAVRYLLAAVSEGADLPLEAAQTLEAAYFGLAAVTDDMREGTRAFLEKRPAAFSGR